MAQGIGPGATELALAVLNGFVWGLAVALLAMGLVLTFGFLRLLNLAHGVFYALGAVVTFYAVSHLGSFVLAVILALAVVGALGLVLEKYLVRPIATIPNGEVLVTFGIAIAVEYGILIVFGGAPQRVPYPIDGTVDLFGSPYPLYRLTVAAVSVFTLLTCRLTLEQTRFGLQVRAANQDPDLARALGLPIDRLTLFTFGGGAACAALAGAMLAPLVAVEFRMGGDIMAISFMVTILGGLTRVGMVAGVAIAAAMLENIMAIWLDPVFTRGAVLLILFGALISIYGRRQSARVV